MAMIASNGKNHYICNANIGCGLAIPSLKTAFYACFCTRLSLYLQCEYRIRLGQAKLEKCVLRLSLRSPFTKFSMLKQDYFKGYVLRFKAN